jgi:hypothetical protein
MICLTQYQPTTGYIVLFDAAFSSSHRDLRNVIAHEGSHKVGTDDWFWYNSYDDAPYDAYNYGELLQ